MNSLTRSLPVLAQLVFVGLSCTTTNITNVTNPAITPTITRFSPDTVWTLKQLTIYGSNFGYDPANVRVTIDTARAEVELADDTLLKVIVPEGARTGLLRVRTYEQTATSAKPVEIKHTFNPHAFSDSLPEGASFSIPGSGMNNYHGTLRITVNGISLPIDSVLQDHIVSHVIPNTYSGALKISDDDTFYYLGTLTVTIPSSWNTLSQIWNRVTGKEYHHRYGYINGPLNTFDSSWQVPVTFDRQIDMNIAGRLFTKTARGVTYTISSISPSTNDYYSLLQIDWDNISHTATISYNRHSVAPMNTYYTADTLWYDHGELLSAPGPITTDIEFVLPSFAYQVNDITTDSTGLRRVQEQVSLSVSSGEFDLILKR